jgi:DNA polymerase-3 subunit epsilon
MHLPFELDRPLAFFDIETTGLSVTADRIIELALIRLSPQGDVLERVRRFNPEMPIPADATRIHGITDQDVADEAPFCRRARSLAELLDPCDLAGFNIRRFDVPFLVAEFQRCGVDFDAHGRRIIDMQQIFHREEPRDLSAAARFYLGREHEEAHTALGDIRTTAAVLAAQYERYPELPRDLGGLHAYCDEIRAYLTEAERWFGIEDGRRIFRRGKHKGRFLEEVAQNEPDYLYWMLGADEMSPDVLRIVRDVLEPPEPSALAGPDQPPVE